MVFDSQTTKIVIMVLFSILPSLMYFFLLKKFKRQWQERLRNIRWIDAYYEYELFNQPANEGRAWTTRASDRQHSSSLEDIELTPGLPSNRPRQKYYIGELSCRYNALSPYLRCAVNPEGPCENCKHYEKKY